MGNKTIEIFKGCNNELRPPTFYNNKLKFTTKTHICSPEIRESGRISGGENVFFFCGRKCSLLG